MEVIILQWKLLKILRFKHKISNLKKFQKVKILIIFSSNQKENLLEKVLFKALIQYHHLDNN